MEPAGYQLARRNSTHFCGKTSADFGVNVYRKSTGDLVLGNSAARGGNRRPLSSKEHNQDFATLFRKA